MTNLNMKILYFNWKEWDVTESPCYKLKEGPEVLTISYKSITQFEEQS